jgi:hypothetical protein
MPISFAEQAALRSLLDQGDEHSMRLTAAGVAWHALIAGRAGAATQANKEIIAKAAWDLGDAFLEETVARLLPAGIK